MKKYFYLDNEKQMILINNFKDWMKDHGEADALWRTSIGYITDPSSDYKTGILRAFRKKSNGKYQACRCNNRIREEDVSRDQVILAWVSLYLNNNFELKDIVKNTTFRLSDRFIMTPTMWLWGRGLIGNKLFGHIAQFFLFFELFFGVIWNKIIKFILKWEEYTQLELEEMLKERGESIRYDVLDTKWKEVLWNMEFSGYALHLSAWMNFTGTNNWFKKLNNKLIVLDADSRNLLLHFLSGKEVQYSDIDSYLPMEEWRWSQRMNKMTRLRILPIEDDIKLDKKILYNNL